MAKRFSFAATSWSPCGRNDNTHRILLRRNSSEAKTSNAWKTALLALQRKKSPEGA